MNALLGRLYDAASVGPWLWGIRQLTGKPTRYIGFVGRAAGNRHMLVRTLRPCCAGLGGSSREHRSVAAAARCAARTAHKLNDSNVQ
jgi:hypothetical protein